MGIRLEKLRDGASRPVEITGWTPIQPIRSRATCQRSDDSATSQLESPPGKRFSYSDAGYALAAAIVERVSGTSYERFRHDNLFAPAGMSQTGFHILQWKAGQVAVGYDGDGPIREGNWSLQVVTMR